MPVTIQQNTDRIQTTHIGSLPRPHAVLDLMKAKLGGEPYDQKLYDTTVTSGRGQRAQAGGMRHRHRDGR